MPPQPYTSAHGYSSLPPGKRYVLPDMGGPQPHMLRTTVLQGLRVQPGAVAGGSVASLRAIHTRPLCGRILFSPTESSSLPCQSVGCWESPWSCPIEHLTTAHFVATGKSVCSGLEQQQQCCTTRTSTMPSDGILNARHHQQTHHESPSRHRYKKRREKGCEQETFMHLFQTHKKYVLA